MTQDSKFIDGWHLRTTAMGCCCFQGTILATTRIDSFGLA